MDQREKGLGKCRPTITRLIPHNDHCCIRYGMASDQTYIPFSQRTGLEVIPPQLKLGEVSAELRRLLDYYVGLEIDRETVSGYEYTYFMDNWARVTKDLHVLFFKHDVRSYKNRPYDWSQILNHYGQTVAIGGLFDFIEFLVRHPKCSKVLKEELAGAFVTARAAYRIVDGQMSR
jgi:hypothetical protein